MKMKNAIGALGGKPKKVKVQVVGLGSKGSFDVHKGALHRALGVKEGTMIPAAMMKAALKDKRPEVRRMAASARGFAGMKH